MGSGSRFKGWQLINNKNGKTTWIIVIVLISAIGVAVVQTTIKLKKNSRNRSKNRPSAE